MQKEVEEFFCHQILHHLKELFQQFVSGRIYSQLLRGKARRLLDYHANNKGRWRNKRLPCGCHFWSRRIELKTNKNRRGMKMITKKTVQDTTNSQSNVFFLPLFMPGDSEGTWCEQNICDTMDPVAGTGLFLGDARMDKRRQEKVGHLR
jgi:hypothetical protein